ncbi:HD domain-containing protein [Alkalihalophilus pseudofirmus]|uniref:HD domain-containing protein n=1 Tax=Alkalihalophilus pseudofirmus TaxID=79885 RepID=A0AAJ2NK04_ALKPS|nr:HD domain-containing phosphohydrolase [Alkalihalophilus pseudofirmus]MDV2883864.1 HD domain-containing protein [Alkalihalophilus pseudofirmus]
MEVVLTPSDLKCDGYELNSEMIKNKTVSVPSGTVINEDIKRSLITSGVKEIVIMKGQHLSPQEELEINCLFDLSVEEIIDNSIDQSLLFEDPLLLEWAKSLFITYLSFPAVREALIQLRENDLISYNHSFHVFMLGVFLINTYKVRNKPLFLLGCLLHDIGKKDVSRGILLKESKLTLEEFDVISSHVKLGARWIQKYFNESLLEEMALSHHERLDGSGYPRKIRGDVISYEVRCLMIIDVISAITLKRPYRSSKTITTALELLFSSIGKYDHDLLEATVNCFKKYPKHSIVRINGEKELFRIIGYFSEKHNRPMLQALHQHTIMTEDVDESNIERFLYWDYNHFLHQYKEVEWNRYLRFILYGDTLCAIKSFEKLTDGLKVEEIYEGIVKKTIIELTNHKEYTEDQKLLGYKTFGEVIDRKAQDYIRKQPSKGKIILTTVGEEQHTFPLKVVSSTLLANGWDVLLYDEELPISDLVMAVQTNHVRVVGFSVTTNDQVSKLEDYIMHLKTYEPYLKVIAGGQALKRYNSNNKVIDYIIEDLKDLQHQLDEMCSETLLDRA